MNSITADWEGQALGVEWDTVSIKAGCFLHTGAVLLWAFSCREKWHSMNKTYNDGAVKWTPKCDSSLSTATLYIQDSLCVCLHQAYLGTFSKKYKFIGCFGGRGKRNDKGVTRPISIETSVKRSKAVRESCTRSERQGDKLSPRVKVGRKGRLRRSRQIEDSEKNFLK